MYPLKQFVFFFKYTILIFFILAGCNNDLDLLERSIQNEVFYEENNEVATQRLLSIMYNNERNERFKIVHISDPHLSVKSLSNNSNSPINLKQSVRFANQKELRINAFVATGDFIAYEEKETALLSMKSFIVNFYMNNHIPSFLCTGNHDSNITDASSGFKSFINKNQINQVLFTTNNFYRDQDTAQNHFYSDVPNPQGGIIRIISLDMIDQPDAEYNTLHYATFSQEQINWLGNVALKKAITANHSILILAHYPFQGPSSDKSTYLCDGDFLHTWKMIPEIIEAYRSRTSIHKTYLNKLSKNKDITVNFDFSNSSGEFICYLGGHAHCFASFDLKGLGNANNNLPHQKMILCTNQAPSETGTVYNRVTRIEDSITSNSFCIYAVDTKEKKVYITFFGAYKPANESSYPEIQSFSYL